MGADFLLYSLPACEISPDRSVELKEIIRNLDDTDYAEIADFFGENGEVEEALLSSVDELVTIAQSREVSSGMSFGLDYTLMFTGGLSWGDHPTEAAETFDRLSMVGMIYDKLLEWSQAEFEQRKSRAEPDVSSSGETEP